MKTTVFNSVGLIPADSKTRRQASKQICTDDLGHSIYRFSSTLSTSTSTRVLVEAQDRDRGERDQGRSRERDAERERSRERKLQRWPIGQSVCMRAPVDRCYNPIRIHISAEIRVKYGPNQNLYDVYRH